MCRQHTPQPSHVIDFVVSRMIFKPCIGAHHRSPLLKSRDPVRRLIARSGGVTKLCRFCRVAGVSWPLETPRLELGPSSPCSRREIGGDEELVTRVREHDGPHVAPLGDAALGTERALDVEQGRSHARQGRHLRRALPHLGGSDPRRDVDAGVAHRLQKAGNMFSVFFTEEQVTDYDAARRQQAFRFNSFFHSMLSQGVYLPPSAFESWFVSSAHDERAVERIAAALPAAARAAAEATEEAA